MRSGVVLLVALVALVVLSPASGLPPRISSRAASHPNAVAFADRMHGVLGTGSGIKAGGFILLTSDGGRTWKTVLRTRRPVVKVAAVGRRQWYAKLQNGETFRSVDSGHHWARTSARVWPADSTCGTYCGAGIRATPADPTWSLRTTGPGAGAQGKEVFRKVDGRWKRVACTNFSDSRMPCGRPSYGGIGGYGYAVGIAGNKSGFGLIWEGRGVAYVTRDGGRHWAAARIPGYVGDVDFASWASVVPRGGVGFVLLSRGGHIRLVETTNAGRTWRVIDRWR